MAGDLEEQPIHSLGDIQGNSQHDPGDAIQDRNVLYLLRFVQLLRGGDTSQWTGDLQVQTLYFLGDPQGDSQHV